MALRVGKIEVEDTFREAFDGLFSECSSPLRTRSGPGRISASDMLTIIAYVAEPVPNLIP